MTIKQEFLLINIMEGLLFLNQDFSHRLNLVDIFWETSMKGSHKKKCI